MPWGWDEERGQMPRPRDLSLLTVMHFLVNYSGPAGGPSHKMQPFSSPKGGSWSQAFHAWTVETEDKTSLFVSTVFCGEFFGKNRALPLTITNHLLLLLNIYILKVSNLLIA